MLPPQEGDSDMSRYIGCASPDYDGGGEEDDLQVAGLILIIER